MKSIVALFVVCTSIASIAIAAPARSQTTVKNTLYGPSIAIGGGTTTLRLDSRFGYNDTLSIRPFLGFPNGGAEIGGALTYDFEVVKTNKLQIMPFVGGGVSVRTGNVSTTQAYFTGGADFAVSDTLELKAALDVPLSSNNSSTAVVLGAGFKF